MTFADKIVSIALLVVSVIAIAFQGLWTLGDETGMVRITVDGELYGQYDFSYEEKTIEIKTEYGENIVKINENSVWVEDASCKDKLDVKAGKIEKSGQMIVCLPNRLLIEISGNDDKVDKVTY